MREVGEWSQEGGERVRLGREQSKEGGEESMEWRKRWQLSQEGEERVRLGEESWPGRGLLEGERQLK